jgi:hypothetical protein
MKNASKINKLLNFIAEKFENNELDNSDMVQIIELCGMYLNLQTISDYAKEHNLSYNGVKNHRQIVNLFGNKYVLENN